MAAKNNLDITRQNNINFSVQPIPSLVLKALRMSVLNQFIFLKIFIIFDIIL